MKNCYVLLISMVLTFSARASLPLYETFNTSESTNAWTFSEGAEAIIQSNVFFEGSALQLNSGAMARGVSNNSVSIWVRFHARITDAPKSDPEVSNSNTSVAFFINSDRKLVVYDSTNATITNIQLETNDWINFDIYCDYQANQWMMTVTTNNGTATATNTGWLALYSTGSQLESLLIANNGSSSVYFDELQINNTEPTNSVVARIDTNGNDIPDWWEKHYFGNAGVTNILDKARNGIMNLRDAYIAGIDPTNPDDALRINKMGLTGRKLGWERKPGRVYDVYYAENLITGFGSSPIRTFDGEIAEFEDDETNRIQRPSGYYKIHVRRP